MKFNEQQHDFGLQDSIIAETNSFSPRTGNYKSWSKEEITDAMQFAASTMEKLGYEVEAFEVRSEEEKLQD